MHHQPNTVSPYSSRSPFLVWKRGGGNTPMLFKLEWEVRRLTRCYSFYMKMSVNVEKLAKTPLVWFLYLTCSTRTSNSVPLCTLHRLVIHVRNLFLGTYESSIHRTRKYSKTMCHRVTELIKQVFLIVQRVVPLTYMYNTTRIFEN